MFEFLEERSFWIMVSDSDLAADCHNKVVHVVYGLTSFNPKENFRLSMLPVVDKCRSVNGQVGLAMSSAEGLMEHSR